MFFLSFVVDLFLQSKRMLFIGSLCTEMSLKFLCTSLVWGRWVMLALFDDIILLSRPFLLVGWLTSACAAEPLNYTLALPECWQTRTCCFPLGIFQEAFWSFHSGSLNTLALSSRRLCISHTGPRVAVTFWTTHPRILEPPVIFLFWATDTSWIYPPYFCHVPPPPPPSSLSKSGMEPVKGLMRLEFIRQWVGTAPCSLTRRLPVLPQRELLGLSL